MEMNQNNQQAYDRGVSVFSPEGRLYQVEYAREAVKRGAPSVGIRTENGVVMAAKTSTTSSLVVSESVEKIHKVEDSLGAVSSGFAADGRRLVDQLRVTTQQDQLRYGENADVHTVVKQVADHIQETTQTGGRRPYGASLIIGGVDETGPRLFEVDPGGTPTEWDAVADGRNRNDCINYFEREYTEDMSLGDGMMLAVDAINEILNKPVDVSNFDMATITEEDGYNQLTKDELAEYCE